MFLVNNLYLFPLFSIHKVFISLRLGQRTTDLQLQDLVSKKESSYHITQLKAFNYDEMETDPAEIARAEAQEFIVEAVLNHSKGDKRGEYDFQIKWLGFDEPKDITWQPWANVKDNEVLNRYLYDNKLRSMLTKQQKDEVIAYKAQHNL